MRPGPRLAARLALGLILTAAPAILAATLYLKGLLPAVSYLADPDNGAWRTAALYRLEDLLSWAPPGLNGSARIELDENMVPHIWAEKERDTWLLMGYVQACSRLFEMDILRRVAEGRLAELVGPQGLENDVYMRSLGLYQAAYDSLALIESMAMDGDEAAAATLEALEAFSQGVNACIERLRERGLLPPEYMILGSEPEPWSPRDSLAVAKLIDYVLGFRLDDLYWLILMARRPELVALQVEYIQWLNETGREIIGNVSEAEALRYKLPQSFMGPVRTVEPGSAFKGRRLTQLDAQRALELMQRMAAELEAPPLEPPGPPPTQGFSNNWVVSAELSATGAPLLANDPHLRLTAPPIWFEALVEAEDTGLHAYGAAFPGVPFIIIGRTRGLSFGYTNSIVDTTDFYYYVWRRGRYLYYSEWLEPTWRYEEILVKTPRGYDKVVVRVPVTIHGPVVRLRVAGLELAAAVRSTTLMPEPIAVWAYLMNHAESVWDALEAQRYFYSPIQNMVAADTDGNILYSPSGLVPVRSPVPVVETRLGGRTLLIPDTGWLPFNGSMGEGEWLGFLPFNEVPRLLNPSSGYVATANNLIAAEYTPLGRGPYLQWGFHSSYRWLRIKSLIERAGGLTPETMASIQLDTVSEAAARIIPRLLSLARPPDNVAGLLKAWDYNMTTDSAAPSLAFEWLRRLSLDAWSGTGLDPLDPGVAATVLSLEKIEMLLEKPGLAEAIGLDVESLAERSLAEAIEELRRFYGSSSPEDWAWGQAHMLLVKHPLGDALAWLNLGPYPVPGGPYTVNVAPATRLGEPVTVGPSLRLVADMSRRGLWSLYTMPGGNDGNPFSPHYAGTLPEWLSGRYHVAAEAETRTIMEQG